MPYITVEANNSFPDEVGARSVFIDSIGDNASLEIDLVFKGGHKERHLIYGGSKFSSPDEPIEQIIFVNRSGVSQNVSYHTSRLVIYDEARIVGEVDASTQPQILTDNNSEFFAARTNVAIPATYSFVGLHNKNASGVVVYITSFWYTASSVVDWMIQTGTASFAGFTDVKNKDTTGPDGSSEIADGNNAAQPGTVICESGSTALTPVQYSFKNNPIRLDEDEMFILCPNAVNIQITAGFELREL